MSLDEDLDLDWSNFITNTTRVDEIKERKDIRNRILDNFVLGARCFNLLVTYFLYFR